MIDRARSARSRAELGFFLDKLAAETARTERVAQLLRAELGDLGQRAATLGDQAPRPIVCATCGMVNPPLALRCDCGAVPSAPASAPPRSLAARAWSWLKKALLTLTGLILATLGLMVAITASVVSLWAGEWVVVISVVVTIIGTTIAHRAIEGARRRRGHPR